MTNKTNKVVLSIFSLQGGGAERFIITLAEEFKRLNYEPHIICFKNQVDYELPDVQVHFLPYQYYRWLPKKIRHIIFASVFDRYVKRHITSNPVLVLSNLWHVDQTLTYSRLPNRVFVIHNTLSKEKKIHTYLTDSILKEVYSNQRIVAVSQGVRDDFMNIVSNTKSLTAIYNPINQKSIQQQAMITNIKKKYPQLANGYLVHVGKFKIQKNHKSLIQAYAKTNQEIPLVLVGEGGLREECEQLCEDLNIAHNVIFTGFQTNPYPWIANATAMVLSSIYEGFGLVIAEALALGIPVISTDCDSGPRELLPKKNLVATDDNEALSQKIKAVMRHPNNYNSGFDSQLLPESVVAAYMQVVDNEN